LEFYIDGDILADFNPIANLTQLRRLTFGGEINDAKVERLGLSCSPLPISQLKIAIFNPESLAWLRHFPQLKSLRLKLPGCLADSTMELFPDDFTMAQLEELQLRCRNIGPSGLCRFLRFCPRLKRLRAEVNVGGADGNFPISPVNTCEQLEQIDLDVNNVTADILVSLADCRQLNSIRIGLGGDQLTSESFRLRLANRHRSGVKWPLAIRTAKNHSDCRSPPIENLKVQLFDVNFRLEME
jgi:hypothetical protein